MADPVWYINADDDQLDDETIDFKGVHAEEANRHVSRLLLRIGADPALDTVPGASEGDLKDLLRSWAYFRAYSDEVVGKDSDNETKAKAKKTLFTDLWAVMLDVIRDALKAAGEKPNAAATFNLGRG